jgi:hypothetical protein
VRAATLASPAIASFEIATGTAHVFAHAADVEQDIWRAAFAGQHKDFGYYQLLEETMRDHFTYRYLLLTRQNGEAMALQPLIIATQDLLTSAGAFATGVVTNIRSKWPAFFRSRMLMAGCLVGEGHLGVVPPNKPAEAARAVAEALDEFARSERVSLVIFKDFPAASRTAMASLGQCGYTRLDGFPALKLPLDFASFDDYLDTHLSKVTRKGIRRKLRKADAASPALQLEVLTDAETTIDEIYPLYRRVAERSDVTFEVFTREYFLEAARQMPGRFRYFIWRQDGRAVAFSFCTLWRDTIYDNDIGLDYSVAHDLHLYYVTFRDIITWALRNRLTRYCSAPFNYDPKLHLRLKPMPVDIYVRHRSRPLNALVRRVAPLFAPAKSDAALRRYFAAHPLE